jgi:hypothetical protein
VSVLGSRGRARDETEPDHALSRATAVLVLRDGVAAVVGVWSLGLGFGVWCLGFGVEG